MSDFVQLKALAKNTIGNSSDYLIDQMNILLEIYLQLNSKVDELELHIKKCLRGIEPPYLVLGSFSLL